MHCPSCGQQQISNETKFCSRCGMPLGLVADVLVNGGYLPQLAELDKAKATKWTRKNGVMFSIFWFIFWVPLMTSVFGGVFNVEILGELFALLGVFGSMMIFIFSLVYLKPASKYMHPGTYVPSSSPSALYGQPANPALPPQPVRPGVCICQARLMARHQRPRTTHGHRGHDQAARKGRNSSVADRHAVASRIDRTQPHSILIDHYARRRSYVGRFLRKLMPVMR